MYQFNCTTLYFMMQHKANKQNTDKITLIYKVSLSRTYKFYTLIKIARLPQYNDPTAVGKGLDRYYIRQLIPKPTFDIRLLCRLLYSLDKRGTWVQPSKKVDYKQILD